MVDSATTTQTTTPPKTEEKGLLSRAWGGFTGIFSGPKDHKDDHPADKAATTTPTPAATQTATNAAGNGADKAQGSATPKATTPPKPAEPSAAEKEAHDKAYNAVTEKVAIQLKAHLSELAPGTTPPKDDTAYLKMADSLIDKGEFAAQKSDGTAITVTLAQIKEIGGTAAEQIPTAKQRDDIADSVGKAVGGNTGGFFGASLDNLLGALMSYLMESVIGDSDKGFKQYMAEAISSGITEDLTKNLKEKGVSDDLSKQVIAATQAEVRKKAGLPAPDGTAPEETLATTKTPEERAAIAIANARAAAQGNTTGQTTQTPAPAAEAATTTVTVANNPPAPAKPEPSKKGSAKARNADQVLAAMHLPERLQAAGITDEQAKDVLARAKQTVAASLKAHSKDIPAKQADAAADALMDDKVVAPALKTITDKEMAREKATTQKLYAATQKSPTANHEYIEARTEREVLAALTGKPAHSTSTPVATRQPVVEQKTATISTNKGNTIAVKTNATSAFDDKKLIAELNILGSGMRTELLSSGINDKQADVLIGRAVPIATQLIKNNPSLVDGKHNQELANALSSALLKDTTAKNTILTTTGYAALYTNEHKSEAFSIGIAKAKGEPLPEDKTLIQRVQNTIAQKLKTVIDTPDTVAGLQKALPQRTASLDNHDIKAQIAAACSGMSGIGKSMADVNNGTCVSPKQVSGGVDLGGQMLS